MPQKTRTPFGVALLGWLTGFAAVLLALVFLALDYLPTRSMVTVRAELAVLAVFAFVAAEALVRMRPWGYRASQALAAAWCVVVMGACVATSGGEGVLIGLVILLFSAGGFLPILAYIRGEWARMSPPARSSVTARSSRSVPRARSAAAVTE